MFEFLQNQKTDIGKCKEKDHFTSYILQISNTYIIQKLWKVQKSWTDEKFSHVA